MTENPNLLIRKLPEEMPQDIFSLPPVHDKVRVFFVYFFTLQLQKFTPTFLVDWVTVYNHSIHIEDGSPQH
jgi:hypothetical protein